MYETWGAYFWEGLVLEGLIIRILRYPIPDQNGLNLALPHNE